MFFKYIRIKLDSLHISHKEQKANNAKKNTETDTEHHKINFFWNEA